MVCPGFLWNLLTFLPLDTPRDSLFSLNNWWSCGLHEILSSTRVTTGCQIETFSKTNKRLVNSLCIPSYQIKKKKKLTESWYEGMIVIPGVNRWILNNEKVSSPESKIKKAMIACGLVFVRRFIPQTSTAPRLPRSLSFIRPVFSANYYAGRYTTHE